MESLWYYGVIDIDELVLLKDDIRTKRMKTIATINWFVQLYVIHPVGQPKIIDDSIISLE